MTKSSIGVVGLGVMGKNLALNLSDKEHSVSVYNRIAAGEETLLSDFLQTNKQRESLVGFSSLGPFIDSLKAPRKILLMISAGPAVDQVVDQLKPLLSAGDIIIDGGNSHYDDTIRRNQDLSSQHIHFIGCGISGGEEGARNGPSLMPGGSAEGYQVVAPLLESIAARDSSGNPCCAHIGPDAAGHFTKMIHNGIEYAEMQLLAEVYHLLKGEMTNEGIAGVMEGWNETDLSSYLLEITINILRKKESNSYVLDEILDKAGNKGTGSWSSQAALKLGMPTTMMTEAVFARYISFFKEKRIRLSKEVGRTRQHTLKANDLEKTYRFTRLINHQQGFDLLSRASEEFNWSLNLSEIARIWTNGCIIRSTLMQSLIGLLKSTDDLLLNQEVLSQLKSLEAPTKQVVSDSILNGIALPAISSSLQYWLAMTTETLPSNLIQAQRDYFGAHTYQRMDGSENEFFHTDWAQ